MPLSNASRAVSPSPARLRASARVALALIRGYQILMRPLLTGSCRFVPTCSEYSAEAISTHGVARGMWLGLRRLARCHPLGGSGLDAVPPQSAQR